MKMNDMFPSNYLKKEDVQTPVQATIRTVTQEEIKGDNGKELKAVIAFVGERLKPMILNRGNANVLEETFGDDSDLWHGKTVEVYCDPSVMFGGKRVGGVRLRVPSPSANGTAHGELWDVSDGKQVLPKQTTEQVKAFLAGLGESVGSVKIKAAGAPRESAKTAEQWLGAPAFGVGEPDDTSVPF